MQKVLVTGAGTTKAVSEFVDVAKDREGRGGMWQVGGLLPSVGIAIPPFGIRFLAAKLYSG